MTTAGTTIEAASMWIWIVAARASAAARLAASKWNGLFDFFVVWLCVAAVVAQRFLRRPALFGNPFGMPLDVLVGVMLVVAGAIYTLCYIPFFTLGHNFIDMVALQTRDVSAITIISSRRIRTPRRGGSGRSSSGRSRITITTSAPAQDHARSGKACCVAEILALPNPFVWWFGLVTVPIVGVLAWLERNEATRCS